MPFRRELHGRALGYAELRRVAHEAGVCRLPFAARVVQRDYTGALVDVTTREADARRPAAAKWRTLSPVIKITIDIYRSFYPFIRRGRVSTSLSPAKGKENYSSLLSKLNFAIRSFARVMLCVFVKG